MNLPSTPAAPAESTAAPIRIWHQATMVLANFPAFACALDEHFARVARPGTQVVTHGTHPGTYATNYPGVDIRHVLVQQLLSQQFVLAGVSAEEQGFDAYAISTLPDYALHESRSALDIPVVGYSESAMLLSCMLGRRFGVLVFIEELGELVRENARRYGLGEKLAAIRHAGVSFGEIAAAFVDPGLVIERLQTAARRLIADGAEAIIPGEAPLCALLARNGVSAVDDVPIVDALGATVKMAESMVDLRRITGLRPCRRGYFGAQPPRKRLDELVDFYGLGHLRPPYTAP